MSLLAKQISRNVRIIVTAALLPLFVASCSSSSTKDAAVTEGSAQDDAIEAVLLNAIGDKPGGLSAALRKDGVTRYVTAGIADSDENELTQNSVFRVGSNSKPIIATMVMQLVEEGQIDLDSTLGNYLPNTTVGADASIRALLSHRAGIANYTDSQDFFNSVFADLTYEYSPEEILDFVSDSPVDTSGRFAYSNTHYILLALLIEALDGGDLAASLQRRITDPLSLDSTRFIIRDEQMPASLVPAWSTPLLAGSFDQPYTSISSSAWSAGALASNVTDLTVFLDALLDGRLVQPATLDEMRQFGDAGYGLGIAEIEAGENPGETAGIWHSGGIFGYLSIMSMTVDRNTAVIVLTNNDQIDVGMVAEILVDTID